MGTTGILGRPEFQYLIAASSRLGQDGEQETHWQVEFIGDFIFYIL